MRTWICDPFLMQESTGIVMSRSVDYCDDFDARNGGN